MIRVGRDRFRPAEPTIEQKKRVLIIGAGDENAIEVHPWTSQFRALATKQVNAALS